MIPFDKITKVGHKNMLDNKLFSVSWILGRFCNYNCSYCWPYARSSTVDHRPFEVYTKAVDEIKRQSRENGFNKFHFSFSGGEPTAYKKFLDLVAHVEDYESEYLSIHMTSNCSPGMKWWHRWLNATLVMDRRSITASYHAEFANEKDFAKNDTASFYVRIDSFSESSIDMLVQAFTVTNDWGEYLKIKENLAVKIIEIVEKNKAGFAFPSQSIYMESLPNENIEIFNPKQKLNNE